MLCSELTNVNYLFYLYVLNCFVVLLLIQILSSTVITGLTGTSSG